jgi:hypothetical protein
MPYRTPGARRIFHALPRVHGLGAAALSSLLPKRRQPGRSPRRLVRSCNSRATLSVERSSLTGKEIRMMKSGVERFGPVDNS